MTSPTSKASTVKPLSEAEKAAWAAHNAAEELERRRRIAAIPLLQRLQNLEAESRLLATIRELHLRRDAQNATK